MSADWPWHELGLKGKATEREIKAAYAKSLRSIDRNDPVALERLMKARKAAMKLAVKNARPTRPSMRELSADVPKTPPQTHNTFKRQTVEINPIGARKAEEQEPNPEEHPEKPHEQKANEKFSEKTTKPKSRTLYETSFTEHPPLDERKNKRIKQLWDDYSTYLEEKKFSVAAEILRQPEFQDMQLRLRAERLLMQHASELTKEEQWLLTSDSLALFEEQFHWLSDNIGVSKRINGGVPAQVLATMTYLKRQNDPSSPDRTIVQSYLDLYEKLSSNLRKFGPMAILLGIIANIKILIFSPLKLTGDGDWGNAFFLSLVLILAAYVFVYIFHMGLELIAENFQRLVPSLSRKGKRIHRSLQNRLPKKFKPLIIFLIRSAFYLLSALVLSLNFKISFSYIFVSLPFFLIWQVSFSHIVKEDTKPMIKLGFVAMFVIIIATIVWYLPTHLP